ncbi:SDR family NAD(P)-dependent oxidoreductase [Citreimonas salinaria]|uniref:NAD(P)-dependent dehydrogenase, short-chain alcohol dehydrogenase family n=1 Tax=Citreimonas salinaria TaxID=321339 RepID=A0A1H3L8W1_9RHOB|nr:SDR family NAD(P)-dependent oxidoreductase [Citreimonas salinaria]SDY60883.1 NAD(P)-dependent dehydrogenase, short-chain alcohol dehydrogenase family [Citreimonas salinaria]
MSGALEGQVAVVTGAGRGIGRAAARALAASGAAVVVNDLDADVAEAVTAEIRDTGGRAETVVAPIGPTEGADACVNRAVERFGRLDIMVANAGVLRDSVLWKTEDDAFDLVVQTHLRGAFTCGRAAARHFRGAGQGGRILLVGSPAGQRGNFGQTAYAAAKAGVAAMARTWSMELARAEVTVNAVIPTALTRMVATIPGLEDAVAAVERGEDVPAKLREAGLGTPEDVAPLFVFLASPAAAGITGQCIGIGGDRLSLWSHPDEAATVHSSGGWSADSIAARWEDFAGDHLQTVGVKLTL